MIIILSVFCRFIDGVIWIKSLILACCVRIYGPITQCRLTLFFYTGIFFAHAWITPHSSGISHKVFKNAGVLAADFVGYVKKNQRIMPGVA
jgi:hypothetical protein